MADIERAYLGWEPVRRLAAAFDVDEKSIRRHVDWFSLDDKRNTNRDRALGRIVEAGILAALEGQATPDHALKALKLLGAGSGGPSTGPESPGGSTWDAEVRAYYQLRRPELVGE